MKSDKGLIYTDLIFTKQEREAIINHYTNLIKINREYHEECISEHNDLIKKIAEFYLELDSYESDMRFGYRMAEKMATNKKLSIQDLCELRCYVDNQKTGNTRCKEIYDIFAKEKITKEDRAIINKKIIKKPEKLEPEEYISQIKNMHIFDPKAKHRIFSEMLALNKKEGIVEDED